MISHDHRLSDAQRRSSEVSAGPHDTLYQFFIPGSILSHVIVDKLLAPGNQYSSRRSCQSQRLLGTDPLLLGIDQFPDLGIFSQELLGPLARCSAVAVVPPVDLLHEVLPAVNITFHRR